MVPLGRLMGRALNSCGSCLFLSGLQLTTPLSTRPKQPIPKGVDHYLCVIFLYLLPLSSKKCVVISKNLLNLMYSKNMGGQNTYFGVQKVSVLQSVTKIHII